MSTLHSEEDRGINNLILSAILLSIATTRSDLHKLVSTTLLKIQENRLDVNIKKVTDRAISSLLKSGVIKVKEKKKEESGKPDVTIYFPSQQSDEEPIKPSPKKGKKKVILTSSTELELCQLGRAAMKGIINIIKTNI